MKATVVDLRRRTKRIMEAIDRNETVTITYRGKEKALMTPIGETKPKRRPMREHPAFGMWRDREDLKDVDAYIRRVRRNKLDDLR